MQKGRLQLCVWFRCTELFSETFASLNYLSSQINYCMQMGFFALASPPPADLPPLALHSRMEEVLSWPVCSGKEWQASKHQGDITYASLIPVLFLLAGLSAELVCAESVSVPFANIQFSVCFPPSQYFTLRWFLTQRWWELMQGCQWSPFWAESNRCAKRNMETEEHSLWECKK